MPELDEMVEELSCAASYLNEELGEWWGILSSMDNRVNDFASEEFEKAYIEEVRSEYKRLKEEFTYVEVTQPERKYKELRHNSEI